MAERQLRRLVGGGRTGVFLTALVVILLALAAPGWIGAVLTVVIVGLLAALMRRTWAVTTPRTRALRIVVLLVLLILAIYKA